MGDDHVLGKAAQIRLRTASQHRLALKGRAGEHQHVDAAGAEGAAGGCPHRVIEYGAVLGELRLLEVVFRHGHVHGGLVKGADAVGDLRVKDKLPAKDLADGLLRQIVVGRPQSAGGQDDVRPPAGRVQRLTQPLGVVAHHGVPKDVDPQRGQALGDHLGVGVCDVAEEQLRPHGDDLSGMRH